MTRQMGFACTCAMIMGLAVAAIGGIRFGVPAVEVEDDLHVKQFGRDEPTGINSGYLFIDLNYVCPPYKVGRVGSGVVVNGVLMNCPLRGQLPSSNRLAKAKEDWLDPLHGSDAETFKNVVRAERIRLTRALEHNSAVFLSSKIEKPLRLPIQGKLTAGDFGELLRIVMGDGTGEDRLARLHGLIKSGRLAYDAGQVLKTAGDLSAFEQHITQTTNLMTRASTLLKEAEDSGPAPPAPPAMAKGK